MQESPIFVKTDQMLAWLMGCTEKFPKSHRFRMAKRIEDPGFAFQEHILAAVTTNRTDRLAAADVQLALLKRRLRMAHEMKLIDLRQYEHVARLTTEVGRLLGAWTKSKGSKG
jgi:hypothetical protein